MLQINGEEYRNDPFPYRNDQLHEQDTKHEIYQQLPVQQHLHNRFLLNNDVENQRNASTFKSSFAACILTLHLAKTFLDQTHSLAVHNQHQ